MGLFLFSQQMQPEKFAKKTECLMRKVTVSSIGRALGKTRGYGFDSRTETFLFSFPLYPER